MVHVVGDYCTEVRQECLHWKDNDGNFRRCEVFKPSVCIGKKIKKDFCIDVDEYSNKWDIYPMTDISFFQAQKICKEDGKRLCQESEWELACEGKEMYPYTTGLYRPTDVCNIDVEHLLDNRDNFINLTEPSTSLTQCVSSFGVRNMNGNADEWVIRDHSSAPEDTKSITHQNALKGGWWGTLRDRCMPSTTGHGDNFHELQIGFRCCK